MMLPFLFSKNVPKYLLQDLREQLSKLQREYDASSNRVKCLSEELKSEKVTTETQANDILRKSSQYLCSFIAFRFHSVLCCV